MLIPVLIGMTLVVFSIIRFIPGNPAQVILGQRATKEAVQQLTVQLGLDQPWYMQYARYIGDLLKGDLGTSIRTGAAITQEIKPYLFATLELAFFAMLIAVFVGVNAGIISAWFKNSVFDYIAMLVALIGVSMPIFWLGLMGQLFFRSSSAGCRQQEGRMSEIRSKPLRTFIHWTPFCTEDLISLQKPSAI